MKGELELNVVFPGLCCDMLFVVANIGSDGLQAARYRGPAVVPAASVGSSNGTVVGGRPIDTTIASAEVDRFLMTSVVLPPDSEIIAPF